MDYRILVGQLLSQEDQKEMEASIELLENGNHQEFYETNKDVIWSILFLEEANEFLDFSSENELDRECFCFAFLCARKHGIQIGGYEDDLTDTLTAFFEEKGFKVPEIDRIIGRETIYTDCGDFDNFKQSMEEINQVLDAYGQKLVIFEDGVYCDCEYTMLAVGKPLAETVSSSWESDNFSIYL